MEVWNQKSEKRRRKLSRRNRQRRKKERIILGAMVIVLVALLAMAIALFIAFRGDNKRKEPTIKPVETESETEIQTETEEIETETEPETETEQYVEITEENREDFVQVISCRVEDDSRDFSFRGSMEQKPVTDDGKIYLLEMKMYEDEVVQEREPLAEASIDYAFTLTAPVLENSPESKLYSKFMAAVLIDGSYVALCDPQYITNPEALAMYQDPYPEAESIKGLLVDPLKLSSNELDDLGVKQAVYNIPVARLLGETTNVHYPTIYYNYNGRTYAFNGQIVSEYDYVFRTLTQKGIVITAILLNNKSSAYPQLIHPLSRSGGSGHYYAFNAAEEEGIEYMAAIGAFLSSRYRDTEHGIVMNWVVGNEVNVRSDWNYMQYTDLTTYAKEYADAVRVFYNSIKSMNANAKVYISLDQQWNRNLATNNIYDSKDLIDAFNEWICREGNIDWGLAHHPYAYPMTATEFWNVSSKYRELILDHEETSIVTIENIHVVTDYMQKEELLNPDGQVRSVILSEMGYSSLKGEAAQAAAFAYAYYIAESNPYIHGLILSRQTDAAEEVAQGLALGLCTQSGARKHIYDVFKYIDTEQSEQYTAFAKDLIGISDWSQVIEGR